MNFNYDEQEYRELFESDGNELRRRMLGLSLKEPPSRGKMKTPERGKMKGGKRVKSGIKIGREYFSANY